MTATPQPVWPAQPAPRMGAGRIVAVVFGVLLMLPGLGLLVGGGVLLWADLGNRTDGFVFSESDDFSTDGYALLSERIELAEADWLPFSAALGTARAEVSSTDDSAVFVGIGPATDVDAYLDGVERSIIDDLGTGAIDEIPLSGDAPSGPPAEEDFWTAQASGEGTQQLDWEPAEGDWVFVVMNADASSGVSVDARVGATVPALGALAWGLLGTGLFLVLLATLLMVLGLRRPHIAPVYGAPYAGQPYAGPPAAPVPPPRDPVVRETWIPPTATDQPQPADRPPGSAAPPGERPGS
jgi:hypothetical protein